MKITLNRSSLAIAFGHVSGVVPGKPVKPILGHCRLFVKSAKAYLSATDEELGICYEVCDADCKNVEVLLPAKRVNDIIREVREDVVIEESDSGVRLTSGRSEFKLPTANPTEYPAVPAFDDKEYFTLPGKTLRDMIRRTIFATDQQSARYALGGVLFDFSDKKLKLIATDSRRLAVMHAPCSKQGNVQAPANNVVVPSKALTLLERTIPDTDDPIHIAPHANDILFKTANATIFSRLVEGRFPRYQDVIPRSHAVSIDLVAGAFHAVVRQSTIVTNEESRGVDFSFGNGSVVLVSQAADVGKSRIEIPISYAGDELTIRFDPRYISDFLKVLPSEAQFSLKLSTEEDPGLLTTGDGYTYVIMPLSREG